MKNSRIKTTLSKLTLVLFGFALIFSLSNCSEDLVPVADPEPVNTSSLQKNPELYCLQSCNITFGDCWDGNGQIGNTYQDFYDYYKCQCVELQDDCEWMGNNLSSPENFSCSQMTQMVADWNDQCYLSYASCVNSCLKENFFEHDNGDDDNDNIPNWADEDEDGPAEGEDDGVLDHLQDTDGDGVLDHVDSDANGNGIPDDQESEVSGDVLPGATGTGWPSGFIGSSGGPTGGAPINNGTQTRRCDPPCDQNQECINGECFP